MINLDSRLPQSKYIRTEPTLPNSVNFEEEENNPPNKGDTLDELKTKINQLKKKNKFNGKNSFSGPKIIEKTPKPQGNRYNRYLPHIWKEERSHSYNPRRLGTERQNRPRHHSLNRDILKNKNNHYQEAINGYSKKIQDIIKRRNRGVKNGGYYQQSYEDSSKRKKYLSNLKGPKLRVNRRAYGEMNRRYIYKRPDWWG